LCIGEIGIELKEFSKSVTREFNAMTGDIHADEDLFEVYVQRLFKRSDFDMLMTIRDDLDCRRIISTQQTYYQFWHKHSGHSFWVKYEFIRNDDNELIWHRPNHLEYSRKFQEDKWPEKVYLIFGFGRRPLRPSFMFCVPLDEVENRDKHLNTLEKFERNPSQPFELNEGLLT
jgi:hypothetical protein